MRCNYCGHELDETQSNCPLCDSTNPIEPTEVFGRGQSMLFFNWLFKYIPYMYVGSIIFTFAGLYHILINLYKGNVGLFVSIFANAIFINMRLAQVVMMIIIIYLRFKQDKVNFARLIIYRHLIQIIELIVLYVVGGAQIGLVDGLTETFIREMFFNLVVFIPVFRYFNKRITIFGFGET
jgi:hypothetical protein